MFSQNLGWVQSSDSLYSSFFGAARRVGLPPAERPSSDVFWVPPPNVSPKVLPHSKETFGTEGASCTKAEQVLNYATTRRFQIAWRRMRIGAQGISSERRFNPPGYPYETAAE